MQIVVLGHGVEITRGLSSDVGRRALTGGVPPKAVHARGPREKGAPGDRRPRGRRGGGMIQ